MARIGKCRKCKKDWVKLVSYGDWKQKCDGIGFCNSCDTEHRLEMRGTSHNYSICEDWEVKGAFYEEDKIINGAFWGRLLTRELNDASVLNTEEEERDEIV